MSIPAMSPVSITNDQLYAEIVGLRGDVRGALLRIEVTDAKAGQATAAIADHESRVRVLEAVIPDDLAGRLVAVERWQWRAAGAIAAVGVVAGLLGGWLATIVAHLK